MRVLLTGFEAFGDFPLNPSQLLVEECASCVKSDLISCILPVDGRRVGEALKGALDKFHPQLVLAFGLANGRSALSLERVAINILDFPIPDNSGWKPEDLPIEAGGPAAYFSGLPLRRILEVLKREGIPCEISNTAGTFVCNQTFYLLAHYSRNWTAFKGGFIHLPCTPELVVRTGKNAPSISLENMKRAVLLSLEVLKEGFQTS
jgi:pyroglutamyl-peptidase